MRRIQRAVVVAAALAGLSALGAGVSFADDHKEDAPDVTAVAISTANAVATWDAPHGDKHSK
ncbi:hypothetical protein [Streptomyces sp. GESEQ-35]|uniref:hypothetical protein n=1 Tax=Streptomyces sp. GESEQ-35 TaxID=2812657 RepID=UPI001B33603F|nr:hypothetical protein [Streptomyces sp. GESEQ-35]